MLKILLVNILKLHNLCYRYAGALAIHYEGIHPKHRLMKYKEWFLEQITSDDIVLDIGCNIGGMPKIFSGKAKFIYGVEIESKLVADARKYNHAPNIEYIHDDATTMDYSDLRPVSVITLSNVLEHIEDRKEFLTSIASRVNWRDSKHMRFLIRVPMIDRDWITLYKKELGVEWRLDTTHYTEYTLQQFQEELAASNIQIEDLEIRYGEIYAICRR